MKENFKNKKIFGTDGIRSKANGEFMNPIFFNKLAIAIDKVIFNNLKKKEKIIIIAKDTRRSGYMIESALSSAFMALGIHVILTGPIPTSVLPFVMNIKNAYLGINISASHNPFDDNGIKIFNKNGNKLEDKIEIEIEKILLNEKEFHYENLKYSFIDSKKIGYLSRVHNAAELYSDYIKEVFYRKRMNNELWDINLDDIKIVVDLANGAAYKIAPLIFSSLNIKNVIFINNKPDGFNINLNCGAVHTENLQREVINNRAHIGIAVDGDADRVVFVDENGKLIDNDKIIALTSMILNKLGFLKNSTVAINISSNFAIEKYLEKFNILTHRVPIGDKYIVSAFEEYDLNFGGEKSGHIMFADFMLGGDGIISGILIISLIQIALKNISENNFQVSKILNEIDLFPQVSKNFDYESKNNFNPEILNNSDFLNEVSKYEKLLKDNSDGYGRILVRKSGTEKKIRLIAEGKDNKFAENCIDNIINLFDKYILDS